jgi:2'-5' RNA ligase
VSSLVIVAIPDENDHVWKISSEKVPHLTLLFLGEDVPNVEPIVQFVQHAANTALKRFYLTVDRRGELGADQADVLFFKTNRYDAKAIQEFRSALLQDNNIRTAYDSATQFDGPWNPHLTLGYPETPAKPDERDFGFYEVSFNKIAVWTGDFDGPDFLLKDVWDDLESPEAVAQMSVPSTNPSGAQFVLEHVGVKGMRWGVRKADVTSGARSVGKAAKSTGGAVGKAAGATSRFVKDVNFESRVESGKAREAVINQASKPFLKQDLPAIKARHGDYGKLKNRAKKPFSKEARAYRKDAKETYIKRLETTANATKNATGNRQYTIRERGIEMPAQGGNLPRSKYFWDVSSRKVEHANGEADFTRLEVLMSDGFITGLKKVEVEQTMAQAIEVGADFLQHYGIKGMHWGVRRQGELTTRTHVDVGLRRRQTRVQAKGGESHPASDDAIKAAVQKQKLKKSGTAALSNQELRELQTRLQLEAQVEVLATTKGKRFVSRQLEEQGKQQLQKGIGVGVRKTAPHVIKKVGKGAATAGSMAVLL